MSAVPIDTESTESYSLMQETSSDSSSCDVKPSTDQAELRKKILAIQTNNALSPSEKARMIQVSAFNEGFNVEWLDV
jgi:hypothetical protein